MKIVGFEDLSQEFKDAARVAVDDGVNILLADRYIDIYGGKLYQPVPLAIKPLVSVRLQDHVMMAFAGTSVRLKGQQFPLQSGVVDVNASLERIVQDCLHNDKRIAPQFLR